MKSKERLLRALKGMSVDRVPWCPNLAYWYENREAGLKDFTQFEIMKKIGADPLIRGFDPMTIEYNHLRMYTTTQKECKIIDRVEGNKKYVIYKTPKGDLDASYTFNKQSNSWFLTKHPIRKVTDYEKLRALFCDIVLEPEYEAYRRIEDRIEEEALIVPMLLPELNLKSSFQAMLEFWVGTTNLVYDVMDEPDEIDETIKCIRKVHYEAARISSESPAEIFLTWEDTSTTNISPEFYKKYIKPEINEWSKILHTKNKKYMQHACGHLRALMEDIGASEIDGIESISPPPTGNISIEDAKQHLLGNKFIVGGIEPVFFMNSTKEELRDEVLKLLRIMKDTPFVLANSDSCPPEVEYWKLEYISEILKR